jgi:hypothetical protein
MDRAYERLLARPVAWLGRRRPMTPAEWFMLIGWLSGLLMVTGVATVESAVTGWVLVIYIPITWLAQREWRSRSAWRIALRDGSVAVKCRDCGKEYVLSPDDLSDDWSTWTDYCVHCEAALPPMNRADGSLSVECRDCGCEYVVSPDNLDEAAITVSAFRPHEATVTCSRSHGFQAETLPDHRPPDERRVRIATRSSSFSGDSSPDTDLPRFEPEGIGEGPQDTRARAAFAREVRNPPAQTANDIRMAQREGTDVVAIACEHATGELHAAFVLWTLRQRLRHVASLLTAAGLSQHAGAVRLHDIHREAEMTTEMVFAAVARAASERAGELEDVSEAAGEAWSAALELDDLYDQFQSAERLAWIAKMAGKHTAAAVSDIRKVRGGASQDAAVQAATHASDAAAAAIVDSDEIARGARATARSAAREDQVDWWCRRFGFA